MEIGIREMRNRLRQHLAEVRHGRTITDHGRPVARIGPVEVPTRLEQLVAEGGVQPAACRKGPAPEPVSGSGGASDLVPDQRR